VNVGWPVKERAGGAPTRQVGAGDHTSHRSITDRDPQTCCRSGGLRHEYIQTKALCCSSSRTIPSLERIVAVFPHSCRWIGCNRAAAVPTSTFTAGAQRGGALVVRWPLGLRGLRPSCHIHHAGRHPPGSAVIYPAAPPNPNPEGRRQGPCGGLVHRQAGGQRRTTPSVASAAGRESRPPVGLQLSGWLIEGPESRCCRSEVKRLEIAFSIPPAATSCRSDSAHRSVRALSAWLQAWSWRLGTAGWPSVSTFTP